MIRVLSGFWNGAQSPSIVVSEVHYHSRYSTSMGLRGHGYVINGHSEYYKWMLASIEHLENRRNVEKYWLLFMLIFIKFNLEITTDSFIHSDEENVL